MVGKEAKQRSLDEEATASLLRRRDLDRYWSALFAPAPKRAGLFALYAFNAELDHILSFVSEPMAGQVRLKWWRDAVEFAAPGNRTGNPVADALSIAVSQYGLSKDRLIGMVDARVPTMFREAPADERGMKESLRETEGAIFELATAILGDRSASAKTASGHAGVAYGLTATLIKLPFLASRQKAVLPSSYLEARGIDLTAVHRGDASENFGAAIADLRGVASRALQHFRPLTSDLDAAAWPAFLPLALVKPYLKAMSAPDYNPLHTVVVISPLRRFWRLWRAARRKKL